jgi:hypothetical protein
MVFLISVVGLAGTGMFVGFLGCRCAAFAKGKEDCDFCVGLIIAAVAFLVGSLAAIFLLLILFEEVLLRAGLAEFANGAVIGSADLIITVVLTYGCYQSQKRKANPVNGWWV